MPRGLTCTGLNALDPSLRRYWGGNSVGEGNQERLREKGGGRRGPSILNLQKRFWRESFSLYSQSSVRNKRGERESGELGACVLELD